MRCRRWEHDKEGCMTSQPGRVAPSCVACVLSRPAAAASCLLRGAQYDGKTKGEGGADGYRRADASQHWNAGEGKHAEAGDCTEIGDDRRGDGPLIARRAKLL